MRKEVENSIDSFNRARLLMTEAKRETSLPMWLQEEIPSKEMRAKVRNCGCHRRTRNQTMTSSCQRWRRTLKRVWQERSTNRKRGRQHKYSENRLTIAKRNSWRQAFLSSLGSKSKSMCSLSTLRRRSFFIRAACLTLSWPSAISLLENKPKSKIYSFLSSLMMIAPIRLEPARVIFK